MREAGRSAGPRKEGLSEKALRMLDLPLDAAGAVPSLTLTGDRDLYLTQYREILAYGRKEIHVDGGSWVLRIRGRDLEIRAMRIGELRITGWISGIDML